MFGKLPELFDRDFAIGFYLPAAFWVACEWWLARGGPNLKPILLGAGSQGLWDAATYGLVSLLTAILLMALNHPVTRLLEGYGILNPFRTIKVLEKTRFRKMKARSTALGKKLETETGASKTRQARIADKLDRDLTTRFPKTESWVLPTAFGNALRAFETYSFVMYSLDAIPGWERLQAVIPEASTKRSGAAKAEVDLWMNIWFASSILLLQTMMIAGLSARSAHSVPTDVRWTAILSIVTIAVSCELAKRAVVRWGDTITSMFDLYRGDLCRALGYEQPLTLNDERAVWKVLSASWVYRLPEHLATLDDYRSEPDTTASKS